MARNFAKEYAKERESKDKIVLNIPKELHGDFIQKLDGKPKATWILDKIREFVNEQKESPA
ncbi:MAG: hypothetical protein LBE35_07545 [Clostridiales bacterium]|jgi:hypothetical protein|nr:hypothetical protein [Clostridiales bacterium]